MDSIRVLTYLILIVLLSSCANRVPLTGGPRDEQPPEIDTTRSFEDEQIFFEKGDITLYFDEYVQIRDASRQLVVSPPLTYPPTLTSRLRRVQFAFHPDEQLKENTTYVINFGSAIQDFNEGNKLENFTRVFSTGAEIDSLEISGVITDALTGSPVDDCLVMLYTDTRDSVVYQQKPYYFARTDQSGRYRIKNLRADTFKIIALTDQNIDYLYDERVEQIGHIDTAIILQDTLPQIDLAVYRADLPASYLSYTITQRGQVTIEMDRAAESSVISRIDSGRSAIILPHTTDPKKLDVWYIDRGASRMSILHHTSGDTVSIRIPNNSADPDTMLTATMPQQVIHPSQSIEIAFDRPLVEINQEYLSLIDTTSATPLSYDVTLDGRSALLTPTETWPVSRSLELSMLPGAVRELWGYTTDTMMTTLSIGSDEDFGAIELTLDSVALGRTYVIELLDGDTEIFSYQNITSDTVLTIPLLRPREYSVQIYWDQNENGRWDSGNYLKHRQPEPYYPRIVLEKLRENWILDHRIDMSDLKKKKNEAADRKSE